MNALFNLAINNLKKNKFKVICLASMILIMSIIALASINFGELAVESKLSLLREETLNTQIKIVNQNDDERMFFIQSSVPSLASVGGIRDVIPRLGTWAVSGEEEVYVVGTNLQSQDAIYSFRFSSKDRRLYELDDSVIITQQYAQRNSVSLNDLITLDIEGSIKTFEVRGISENNPLLSGVDFFVPLESLQEMMDLPGKIYSLAVTIDNLALVDEIKDEIDGLIAKTDFQCDTEYNLYQFHNMLSAFQIALRLFLILTVFVTAFLFFSLYRTLIYERLPQVGILKSLGVKLRQIIACYYLEFLIAAFPAILAGHLIGAPLLHYLLKLVAGGEAVYASFDKIVLSALFCTALTFIIPVPAYLLLAAKSRKKSVALIKKPVEEKGNRHYMQIIGLLVMGMLLGIVYYLTMIDFILLVLCVDLIAVLLLVFHSLYYYLLKVISHSYNAIHKYTNYKLDLLTEQFDKSVISTNLLVIGISVSMTCVLVANIIGTSTINVYGNTDILLNNLRISEEIEVNKILDETESITENIKVFRKQISYQEQNFTISGIQVNEYAKAAFEEFRSGGFQELKGTHDIILSETIAKSLDKKVGDTINLKGKDRENTYRIVALMNTFENMGQVAFIKQETFEQNFEPDFISHLINTSHSEPKEVRDQIEDSIPDTVYYNINTIEELRQYSEQENQMIFNIMYVWIIILMIILLVGLTNNIIVNLIRRQKNYAVMMSLGVSGNQLKRLILLEGVNIAVYTLTVTPLIAHLMQLFILNYLQDTVGYIDTTDMTQPLLLLFIGCVLCVICHFVYSQKVLRINYVNYLRGDE